MSSTIKTTLPKFLNYEQEETNYGYEAIMDFFLSYILRCSHQQYQADYPKLYEYARISTYHLIRGENRVVEGQSGYFLDFIPDDFRVIEVTTKRQKNGIDLLTELTVLENSQPQKYLLNIENKYYSELKKHQLPQSREYVENNYKDFTIINLFIALEKENDYYTKAIKLCSENETKFLTIDDIASYWEKGKTGSELFDTLWYELAPRN